MNTGMLSEYAAKKRNVACAQHQAMTIRYAASEMHQQDTDVLTATETTQHELWSATREKNM